MIPMRMEKYSAAVFLGVGKNRYCIRISWASIQKEIRQVMLKLNYLFHLLSVLGPKKILNQVQFN